MGDQIDLHMYTRCLSLSSIMMLAHVCFMCPVFAQQFNLARFHCNVVLGYNIAAVHCTIRLCDRCSDAMDA